MAVFSKYPIDTAGARTFQTFRWADMPGALLPIDPATGQSWYSPAELEVVRLSSKSHWDVPIQIGSGRPVHFLVSHPTPPVFDGPEDRNGRRNFDEIRFWADYVPRSARRLHLRRRRRHRRAARRATASSSPATRTPTPSTATPSPAPSNSCSTTR